jgi:hypothetical protein
MILSFRNLEIQFISIKLKSLFDFISVLGIYFLHFFLLLCLGLELMKIENKMDSAFENFILFFHIFLYIQINFKKKITTK